MDLKKIKLAIPSKLVSAIIYFILIGVVLYGTRHNVYDGFGKAVPWVISAIFLVTGIYNLCGYIHSIRVQGVVDDYISSCDRVDAPAEDSTVSKR